MRTVMLKKLYNLGWILIIAVGIIVGWKADGLSRGRSFAYAGQAVSASVVEVLNRRYELVMGRRVARDILSKPTASYHA
jgi:hypothetical protein